MDIAAQLSHDIRSPLSALSMVVGILKDIPEEQRVLIHHATQRINMEFMEGAAEFVGVQSAIDAGAMSESKAMEWIGLSLQRLENEGHPDELFYRTGAMALLILKKVDPASFKQVVLAITQAQMVERMVMFELFKWANQ